MDEHGSELIGSLRGISPDGFKFILQRVYASAELVDFRINASLFFIHLLQDIIIDLWQPSL